MVPAALGTFHVKRLPPGTVLYADHGLYIIIPEVGIGHMTMVRLPVAGSGGHARLRGRIALRCGVRSLPVSAVLVSLDRLRWLVSVHRSIPPSLHPPIAPSPRCVEGACPQR